MKKTAILRTITAIFLCATLLITGASAVGLGDTRYTNTMTLAGDLEYTNYISVDGDVRGESYVFETTPGGNVRPIVSACDTIYGGMTLTSVTAYAERLGYNVVGAINADFFSTTTRVPMGIVIEDGIYKSSPENRNAVLFDSNGRAAVASKVTVAITLINETSGASVDLTHFNKNREETGGLYLMDEHFSTVSTRTSTDGWMVRFKILDGEMRTNGTMTLEVTELYEGAEAQEIGEGYMILTAATQSGYNSTKAKFAVGDRVTLKTACTNDAVNTAVWATGAGDILVQNGQMTDSSTWDSGIRNIAAPRTALGIKNDGTVVSFAMDGRKTITKGATLKQLAEEMISLGCTTVINFDGGGSTTAGILKPGDTSCTVVNNPSDGSQRRCGTFVLFVSTASGTGEAEELYIRENGSIVLAGAELPLTVAAADNAGKAVKVTENAQIDSVSGLGTVSGNTYLANRAGVDLLDISAGWAQGSGTIHVVSGPDAINVKDAATGKTLDSVLIMDETPIKLAVTATYLTEKLIYSDSQVTYATAGNIGTITSDGVYTPKFANGVSSGSIVIKIGSFTKEIPVKYGGAFEDMAGHWAEKHVTQLFKDKIVTGLTDSTFGPDKQIKRGDFILMLYRAAGEPAVNGKNTFDDVPSNAYYCDAITWAQKAGIAQGVSDTVFQPTKTLNREQAFTFVYRALDELGIDLQDGDLSVLSSFSDKGKLSDYAKVPAATLIENGILSGDGGKLSPKNALTRAQMAKILAVTLYGE